MNSPSQRRSREIDIKQYVNETAKPAANENSYMFPIGTRPADSPRKRIAMPSNSVPSQVRDIPIFPARRPSPKSPSSDNEVETEGLSKVAVDPIRTWCDALVRCAETSMVSILRPLANETLNATMAPVKAVIDP